MDILSVTKRQPLDPDNVLYLNDEEYIINSVKGMGTSSIVYEASLDGRKIILKELYPEGLGVFRDTTNSLIIPESRKNDFQSYKDGLEKAYKTQLKFHNYHKSRNYTSEPQKLYKYNNTLYVVMHLANGNSYDQTRPDNILSILEVGKALTEAIRNYHEKGFLNLDIKPQNIFVFPETNQLIQLFDFNTVCTKDEVLQGRFSFSNGYAAPEVKDAKKGNGKLSEIDERADIFSIGSVIFEKIMGRIPKVADQRSGKKWKFENNPYLKDTVPQLQKGITDLFRKTLAVDKNDRYSSASELIQTLEKLIKLAGVEEVFLKNQRISPCAPKDIYISRASILSDIAKRLNEHGILYLYALGGSGKSETAREYAEKYANKYDFIQSVFYTDSLKKTIADLDFVGLEDKDRFAYTNEEIDRLYKYKYGLLGNKALYGTNTLLIIDNYDYSADPASEEYQQNFKIIKELKKLNIHILFTTRIRPSDSTECLELENLTPDELRDLFFKINPTDKGKPERIDLVNEIIEVSYKHTMTVKLTAMQSKKYKKTLKDYLDILKSSGLKSGITGRITNEKDDETVTMPTVYDHIKALFDFDDLNNKQKYIMVNACLLPLSGLEVSVFSQYIDLENFDTESSGDCEDESIEDLINSGWIAYADPEEKDFTSDTKITLHPLICDIAKNELEPELTDDKCRKFYESFLDLIDEWGNSKNENIRKTIYVLFPDLNKIFNYVKISEVLNYLLFSHDRISIQNHMILSDSKLKMYFGIDTQCTIPNSVTEIGYSAFKNCTSLTQITIPNSVAVIGFLAFENCSSLAQVTIPDSVIEIGCGAFQDCIALTQITIPNSVTEIGGSAFAFCVSLSQITIPDSVTRIGASAFLYCTSLTQVTIPNSVTEIGFSIFSCCTSLTQITIPDSVTEIGSFAFAYCRSLSQITIPDSVIEIGLRAFQDCIALRQVILSEKTKFSPSAFENCSLLSNLIISGNGKQLLKNFLPDRNAQYINIPHSVSRIEDYAFSTYPYTVSITIPESVTEIGKAAFRLCTSLTQITIPDSVTVIGDHTFENCTSLTQITLPNNIKRIAWGSFEYCTSLTQIVIPNSVTEIGMAAFENCTSLTQIIIPDSVTVIEISAFRNCTSLTEITIPDSVTEISHVIFAGCTSLTHITIPGNITEIGDHTFENCTSLKEISIPDGVTTIGHEAFFNCTSLNIITVLNTNTDISNSKIGYITDSNGLYIKNEDLIIKGYKGSTAEQYAKEHGFKFVPLD